MKKNFKYFMMLAVFAVGFASCSSDDDHTDGGGVVTKEPKSVKLRFTSKKINTYAEEGGVSGDTPDIYDGKVYFINGNAETSIILSEGDFSTTEIAAGDHLTGKTFQNVNGQATHVYIVSNIAAPHATITTLPTTAIGTTLGDLKKSLMEIDNQTNAITDITLHGIGAITGAAGSQEANVSVGPAVSRIEIKELKPKTVAQGAQFEVTAYTLQGIFVNNTYAKLGLDHTTTPVSPANGVDLVNFGQSDNAMFTAGYNGLSARLFDFNDSGLGTQTGVSTKPTIANGTWAYNVFPATVGTILNGNSTAENAAPKLVLVVDGVTSSPAATYDSPCYLNVNKFVLTSDGSEVTAFEEGNVYMIDEILFAGEDLSGEPTVSNRTDIIVKITVKPWTGVSIQPEL